jgi:hypothetical protein
MERMASGDSSDSLETAQFAERHRLAERRHRRVLETHNSKGLGTVEVLLYENLESAAVRALEAEARNLGRFLRRDVTVEAALV